MADPQDSVPNTAQEAPSALSQLARARAAARPAPPVVPADPRQEALAEADRILTAETRSCRMESRDVRELVGLFILAFVMLLCVAPASWWARSSQTGQTLALHASIIASVVAAWGAVRAAFAGRKVLRGIARTWLVMFLLLSTASAFSFVFCGWHADWHVVRRGPARPAPTAVQKN
jgi:hypothetical protein